MGAERHHIIGATAAGGPFEVDVGRLIGSHACIVANSGGGKSGLIRRLLEVTHGQVQHIVLDVEDEFYTLRERFDYVIAGGDGADAPATPANAEALAIGALTHGFSLVAQINDLGDDAPAFVARFLDALISAPRDLWRPLLIVVDETQRFAPSSGSTEATPAVKAIVQRGRKRGFTGVFASLALSEINPRLRGLVNNWMLGRVGQSLDRDTMARQLGFRPSSSEALGLQSLEPRTFWGFGPALSPVPTLFRVADVETTPVRPGQAKLPTPPPAEALREILQGLSAPAEKPGPVTPSEPAEALDAGLEAGKVIRDQKTRIHDLETALAGEKLARAQAEGRADSHADVLRQIRKLIAGQAIGDPSIETPTAGDRDEAPPSPRASRPAGGEEGQAPMATAPRAKNQSRPSPSSASSSTPEERNLARGRKALAALVCRNIGLTERQWAWVAGFSRKGGTWGTYKSALIRAGLVEERSGKWWPTGAGYQVNVDDLGPFPALGPELVRAWKKRIPGVGRMVDALLDRWPDWTLRSNLADALGMSAAGGTFGTYLSRLRSAGLIEVAGKRLRLNPEAMGDGS